MKEEKYSGKMKKKPELSFRIFSFFIVFFLIPQFTYSESIDQIINGLQKYLNDTNDFTASFTQITQLQSFGEKQIANGEVYIMKPGQMTWEYQKPELQTIIINSRQVWMYTPEDKQVIKTRIEKLGTSAIYKLFLSTEIKINEIFNISEARKDGNSKQQTFFLELFPKSTEVNVNKVLLELSRVNYEIKSFATYDQMDNITTVKFTRAKRNKGIKPSVFDFKIPKGVEIITSEDLGAS